MTDREYRLRDAGSLEERAALRILEDVGEPSARARARAANALGIGIVAAGAAAVAGTTSASAGTVTSAAGANAIALTGAAPLTTASAGAGIGSAVLVKSAGLAGATKVVGIAVLAFAAVGTTIKLGPGAVSSRARSDESALLAEPTGTAARAVTNPASAAPNLLAPAEETLGEGLIAESSVPQDNQGNGVPSELRAHPAPPQTHASPRAEAQAPVAHKSAAHAASPAADHELEGSREVESGRAPSDVSPRMLSLSAEVASLQHVRVLGAAGRTEDALQFLASRSFVGMKAEARVLKIELLVASGKREEAAREARSLLSDEPSIPQAKRLRAMFSLRD
ncbi:MAG: hypothetical protein KBF88_05820 [Polyangiaceae bacterium]|nr:hypothetical protein [Polyangiaceae bacterium]